MEEVGEDKLRELKEAYEMFDRNKDGYINFKELGNILRCLGHDFRDPDLKEMLNAFDKDDDGKIDFTEFLNLVNNRIREADIEEELMEAFRMFDKNKDGSLTVSELKHTMLTLGERMTDAEVDEMLAQADPEGKGFINYRDFVSIMLAK